MWRKTSTRDDASRSSFCRQTRRSTGRRSARIEPYLGPEYYICDDYEAIQSEGQTFVAMELLEGERSSAK